MLSVAPSGLALLVERWPRAHAAGLCFFRPFGPDSGSHGCHDDSDSRLVL